MTDVAALFGQMDIYLFDQIQRGRIHPGQRIFDAGCGGGRNIEFFLREGYPVAAVDAELRAIAALRELSSRLAPALPETNFRAERLESSSFEDGIADVVISSAVLHFASDETEFEAMLRGSWRLLAADGLFFCRLASNIGLEQQCRPLGGRRFALPDGSERFLVDEKMLIDWTAALGATLLDPIKTTVVQESRSMTTWVMRKGKLRDQPPTSPVSEGLFQYGRARMK